MRSDADDIQGRTTKEGTHDRGDVLYFDPRLPGQLDGLSFPIQFWETPILVTVTGEHPTLAVHPESVSRPVGAGIPGDVRELRAGDRAVFGLSPGAATARPPGGD
jgi:trehalose/maltose hydrolase-like predicted phosphorylase